MKDLPAGTLILIIVLSLLLLAVIVISIRAFAEPFILKVTHRKMFPAGNNDGFKRQDGSSAPSGSTPGLRLFFFTDLHADICRISSSKLISAIRDAHASSPIDAVVFGGDICNRKKINLKGLAYLEEISAACKELGIATKSNRVDLGVRVELPAVIFSPVAGITARQGIGYPVGCRA